MEKIYACLAGNWVCLNDDPKCVIGDKHQEPYLWWKEGAPIYAPAERSEEVLNKFYCLDYVHVYYRGRDWRINPIFIQVVTE